MILVKAPLRLSFFGGGSDIPAYYCDHGTGATLSAAFNKYVYAALMSTPQPHIKVAYSTTEYAATVEAVRHDIVREALRHYRLQSHIEISSFADIPTVGTGLGASSAFNVALVVGLDRFVHKNRRTPQQIVECAAFIELVKVGSPIGYQDHIAAAYGGIVFAEYMNAGPLERDYKVQRVICPHRHALLNSMFLVKVPARAIDANTILTRGLRPEHIDNLVKMTYTARNLLEDGNFHGFGELLHEGWEEKKRASDLITTPEIDALYARARHAGILGGKLLGAGNGGYLLLCAESPEAKTYVQRTLFADTTWYNVALSSNGAAIVYED